MILFSGLGRRRPGHNVYLLPNCNHGISTSLFRPNLCSELHSSRGTGADRGERGHRHHLHRSLAGRQGPRPQGARTQGLCPAQGLVLSTTRRATQYTKNGKGVKYTMQIICCSFSFLFLQFKGFCNHSPGRIGGCPAYN